MVKRVFTLSRYEAQEYGIGHTVDGLPAGSKASFAESMSPLCNMIREAFYNEPTGTKIEVTMKVRKERMK